MSYPSSLVVFSGGQDSTTCLYWAANKFAGRVHTITFDYGQRHGREVAAAVAILGLFDKQYPGRLGQCDVVSVPDVLRGTSPLVDRTQPVGHYPSATALPGGVEPTFVPCRNSLFLTIAFNRAVGIGAKHVVTGVCEEDYGGYPDCRARYIEAMQCALNLGIFDTRADDIQIQTPLMWLSKRDTVYLANSLRGCMDALAYSHTCYDGEYPPNPHNHASILRARGFRMAGINDPLIVRAKAEGKLPGDYPDDGYVHGTKYELRGDAAVAHEAAD